MKLTVGEIAKLFGISVRTLRYYDERALLPPSETGENGYRYYDEKAVETLSQILFYRTLDFPLEKIAEILSSPAFDRIKALREHRTLLLLRRRRMDELIQALDTVIGGNEEMKTQKHDAAAEYEKTKNQYAEEVRQKWGDTPQYAQYGKKTAGRTEAESRACAEEMEEIFRAFAANMDMPADSEPVRDLVKRWQAHITRYYYDCSDQMLACLGQMYTADERFTQNIDQYGDGTAKFLSEAIASYVGA